MKKLLIIGAIVAAGAAAFGVLKLGGGTSNAKVTAESPKQRKAREKKQAAAKLDAIQVAEKLLTEQGCKLAPLSTELEDGVSVVRYELQAPELLAGFYLRNTAERRAMLFQKIPPKTAAAAKPAADGLLTADRPGMLSIYPTVIIRSSSDDGTVSVSVRTQRPPVMGWEAFEIIAPEAAAEPAAAKADTPPATAPPATAPPATAEPVPAVPPHARRSVAVRTAVHEFEVADGFMRKTLAQDDGWKIVSGQWAYNQHGGGLPSSDAEAASMAFQRAANPFSVVGTATGGTPAVISYDTPVAHGDSYVADARFYFGASGAQQGMGKAYPVATFVIAQGELDGRHVGFGWSNSIGRWVLCLRTKTEPWQVLNTWPERPPRLNWIRVGVGIAEGHVAIAYLDGRELGRVDLGVMVSGNFHVHAGSAGAKIEFDDVSVRPHVDRRADLGRPIFAKSRSFSEKSSADRGHDPLEFEYWAKGTNAFICASGADPALGLDIPRATDRFPMYSDFTYRSTPELAPGEYRFIVLRKQVAQEAGDKLAEFRFQKVEGGWVTPVQQAAGAANHPAANPPAANPPAANPRAANPAAGGPQPAGEPPVFTLEFGRRDGEFGQIKDNAWKSLGFAHVGPVHLMIVPPAKTTFEIEQHELYSKSMFHAMFEQAPSDWYWVDGQFGMNFRWACQPGWNFMGGKSAALAATFSKAAYYGEQEVECYFALSMVVPANQYYYLRRDFGLSFCTDGRNLDSGYTLVFGGWNNTKTALFKRGLELASVNTPQFLFPVGTDHGQVHKLWWNFDFAKRDKRVVVKLNGNVMFSVDDPDPIDGGQIGFWTVGNGFVVSRANIVAEKEVRHPEKALLPYQEIEGVWSSPLCDGVMLRQDRQGFYVENPLSGGMFAARTVCPVDLARTPVLELPLHLDDDAKVNLHIEMDGRPWLVKMTAPVEQMCFVLGPGSDAAFPFGRPTIAGPGLDAIVLGEARPQGGILRVDLGAMLKKKGIGLGGQKQIFLTVGNTSNSGYLLAGFGGNHAGTKYWVGQPKWYEGAQ